MKKPIIQIANLSHNFGKKVLYKNLSLDICEGEIFGILGKNGAGKSTLINILMGFIKPLNGQCRVFGYPSHDLPSHIKSEIALLHEGFISYDFLTIEQVEKFFAPFYQKWDKKLFYDLVELMNVPSSQKLKSLSFGQKSQVILGLLFAQNPQLIILDDYSMGLDVGYRKLFVQYLKQYCSKNKKTILISSHVLNDLTSMLDCMIILRGNGNILKFDMDYFLSQFKCYEVDLDFDLSDFEYENVEIYNEKKYFYSFKNYENLAQKELDFEDKFLGLVGKY